MCNMYIAFLKLKLIFQQIVQKLVWRSKAQCGWHSSIIVTALA